jgi:membrane protein DedA with SNARE-associated domain
LGGIYSIIVEGQVAEALAWLTPRALLLALLMPPLIRIVGHLLPEEIFMVAIGVLAAASGSPREAAVLLLAVTASHFVTDQAVYLSGRWLRPRLGRFPRLAVRLESVTESLAASPAALVSLIPARVLPLGRAAWLAGCGVVRIPWPRFALVDLAALVVHVSVWSGLGWWLAGDLARLESTARLGRLIAVWVAVTIAFGLALWLARRRWSEWQPATARAVRRVGHSLRQMARKR